MKKYKDVAGLKSYVSSCSDALFSPDNLRIVEYRKEYINEWQSELIKQDNEKLLKDISGSANVYAIFVSDENGQFKIKYIGQSKQKGARTRLTNHLIKKHKKTGAKLQRVIDSVRNEHQIGVTWVQLEPESLRHYVEETLISSHELEWNVHGQTKT